nr:Ig-like domain-containing protein [Microcystis viridis]
MNDADNSSLVNFEFSETVNGFTAGDVSVSGGTLSNFTQVDGNSYTATFTADDAVETTGSVSVAAASYSDVAGNTGGAGTDTVTIDTKNPTLAVDIVDASLNDADNSSLVNFEFSETVNGFTAGDVSVSGGTPEQLHPGGWQQLYGHLHGRRCCGNHRLGVRGSGQLQRRGGQHRRSGYGHGDD